MTSLKPLFASLALATFATVAAAGCAVDANEPGADADAADSNVSEEELNALSKQFIGSYSWAAGTTFVDFEKLTLEGNGDYSANVDSGLVNPAVRCVRFPCTLPEAGKWSAFKSGGKTKIRFNPDTAGKPSRSYWATVSPDSLTLTRNLQTTTLAKNATITCANVRCAAGTHCEMKGINGGAIPVCLNDPPTSTCANVKCSAGFHCEMKGLNGGAAPVCIKDAQTACKTTGCSGQICSDKDMFTTCEFRPEYACYRAAQCARQADGNCGWTQTAELTACLANP